MPNWNYNLITLTAKNDAAKKQIHTFIDQHIIKRSKPNWNDSLFEIDNKSIIPMPEGIVKLDSMCAILQGEDGSIKPNPNYDENAEKEQRAYNLREYGYEDWYSFCIDKWGSKWGFCHSVFFKEYGEIAETLEEIHAHLDKNGYIEFKSECAWSTATGLLEEICNRYPDIEMRDEWGEEQVTEYYGVFEYTKEKGFTVIHKSEMNLDEAYDMLGRLNLVNIDADDGYFINREKGIIDYDERLDEGSDEYIPEDKREGIVFGTH